MRLVSPVWVRVGEQHQSGGSHVDQVGAPEVVRVEGVGGLVVVCQRVRAQHAAVIAAEVGKGHVVVAGDSVDGGVAFQTVPGVPAVSQGKEQG